LVVDEIGYLPLERPSANLLFALVARRCERGSIVVTSNRGFEASGDTLAKPLRLRPDDGMMRTAGPPRLSIGSIVGPGRELTLQPAASATNSDLYEQRLPWGGGAYHVAQVSKELDGW
jgi:hypothetical protein